jgi:hypothetical protein
MVKIPSVCPCSYTIIVVMRETATTEEIKIQVTASSINCYRPFTLPTVQSTHPVLPHPYPYHQGPSAVTPHSPIGVYTKTVWVCHCLTNRRSGPHVICRGKLLCYPLYWGEVGFTSVLTHDIEPGVRFLTGTWNFSLLHSIQISSGPQPASHPMGTGGRFPGGTAARGWNWPLTSIWCWGREWWSYTSTPHVFTVWCLIN